MNSQQLRASLLQMAIEGKLVPQLETESDVESFADEPEDVPFAIPEKWKWTYVGNVIQLVSGRDLEKSLISETETGVPYITGASQIHHENVVINRWTDSPLVFSEKGDLLLTCKGTVGKIALNTIGRLHIARQIMAIRPSTELNVEYVKYFLQSVSKSLANNAKSMIPGIDRKAVLGRAIPVPPFEEQRRIVEKLEELLPLVDEYGKAQEQLDQLNAQIGSKLRASLLQEAIQGKLVPQLETEPAVEAFADEPEDVPFAIPEKWKWVKLNYVADLLRGVTFPASAKRFDIDSGLVRCLTTGSVQQTHKTSSDVFIDKNFIKKGDRYLKHGDVVISSANSRELVGKSFMWKGNIEATFGGFLTVARFKTLVIPTYLSLIFRAYFHLGVFKEIATQTTNIANISNKQLLELYVPVPPIAEQKRIVEKLEGLLSEVDKLVQ